MHQRPHDWMTLQSMSSILRAELSIAVTAHQLRALLPLGPLHDAVQEAERSAWKSGQQLAAHDFVVEERHRGWRLRALGRATLAAARLDRRVGLLVLEWAIARQSRRLRRAIESVEGPLHDALLVELLPRCLDTLTALRRARATTRPTAVALNA